MCGHRFSILTASERGVVARNLNPDLWFGGTQWLGNCIQTTSGSAGEGVTTGQPRGAQSLTP